MPNLFKIHSFIWFPLMCTFTLTCSIHLLSFMFIINEKFLFRKIKKCNNSQAKAFKYFILLFNTNLENVLNMRLTKRQICNKKNTDRLQTISQDSSIERPADLPKGVAKAIESHKFSARYKIFFKHQIKII